MRRSVRRSREWRQVIRPGVHDIAHQPGPDAPAPARQNQDAPEDGVPARAAEPRAFARQPDDVYAIDRMRGLVGKTWTNRSRNSETVLFDDLVCSRVQKVLRVFMFLWVLCACIPPMWSGYAAGGEYHENVAALFVNLLRCLPWIITATSLDWLFTYLWKMIPTVMTESFRLVGMADEPEVDLRPESLRITDRDRVHRPLVGRLEYVCVMHKVTFFFDWRIPQIIRNVEIPLELVAQALNSATLQLRGEEAELVFSNLLSRTPYVNYDRFALMDDCPPVLLASMLCRVVHGHNLALYRPRGGQDF